MDVVVISKKKNGFYVIIKSEKETKAGYVSLEEAVQLITAALNEGIDITIGLHRIWKSMQSLN